MPASVSTLGVISVVAGLAVALAVVGGAAVAAERLAGPRMPPPWLRRMRPAGQYRGCRATRPHGSLRREATLRECDVEGLVATITVVWRTVGFHSMRARGRTPRTVEPVRPPEPEQGGVCMVCIDERTPVANGKKLVIVESPTKMKSIQGYLGDDYEVLSSVGHIRDLASKKEIPADKKARTASTPIDVENDFDPFYVVNDRKTKTVAELKRALKTADEVLLATDGDREGEAIAWHLLEVLKPKVPVRRMIFHEITKDAIKEAAEHTRELDVSLVDAQETRRVLDRLYGWDVSPVLWRKVGSGREGTALSAGRVQSAATRMVVERERERMAFVSASYWDVEALASQSGSSFTTRLNRLDGAPIARGGDYDDNGQLKKAVVVLDEAQARALATRSPPPARRPSPRSRRSPARAARAPPSRPPRCSRRPAASSR